MSHPGILDPGIGIFQQTNGLAETGIGSKNSGFMIPTCHKVLEGHNFPENSTWYTSRRYVPTLPTWRRARAVRTSVLEGRGGMEGEASYYDIMSEWNSHWLSLI
jgi:hypothetical protein